MASGIPSGPTGTREPEDIITETELIQMFCDVVSKNGNLLLGVGPRPDGTVPEVQQAPLRGLGAWLDVNGEAIYGSRPWVVTESVTADGTPLRFTKSGEGIYVLVMGMPPCAPHHHAGGRRLAGAAGAPRRVRRPAGVVGRARR